jgi:molybdenum cofactor sulfurtransferase
MRLVAENFPWHSSSHFAYLAECHTSAVGLRQYAAKEKAECHVLTDKDFEDQISGTVSTSGTKLVVFPAMSNFCGKKYPIRRWTEVAHEHDWHVLLDAAAFVATSPLDLSQISPDFVALSFYKIFGYPTGTNHIIMILKK